MSAIFISYRRADAGGYAGRIFDSLCRAYGDKAVFRDVDTIEVASRFPDAIRNQLEDCRVFIPIIGQSWLAPEANGKRRLDDPRDWVHIEIATALERGICIIPVTVGGASMPTAEDLPDRLKALALLQRRDLRDGDTWVGDVDRLEQRIAKELGHFSKNAKRRALAAAGLVALSVLMALGWQLTQRWAPDPKFDRASEPVIIFDSTNKEDVTQRAEGPPRLTQFDVAKLHLLTHVYTYHWNQGRGSTAGRVKLRNGEGKIYGPWEVAPFAGHNDAPNVNWVVQPRIILPPGKYTVIDSEPRTWSYNAASKDMGFALLKGLPAID